jgi:hypothetical protein
VDSLVDLTLIAVVEVDEDDEDDDNDESELTEAERREVSSKLRGNVCPRRESLLSHFIFLVSKI